MKALVIYDSVYGNTEKVAKAVGEALSTFGETQVLKASEARAEILKGVELLVIGAPTQAARATKAMQDFLKSLPKGSLRGVRAAAFDTRIAPEDMDSGAGRVFMKLFGYAAKPMSDRLKENGAVLAAQPEGFYVTGTEGPLREGELDRAAAWAKTLLR